MTFACYEQLDDGKRQLLWKYWVHTAFLPKSGDSDATDQEYVSSGIGVDF